LKNKRISAAHLGSYRQGKRRRVRAWSYVERISKEELALAPWFLEHGWKVQWRLVTNVSGESGLPRCFWLDFSLPDQKLCVEIDGTSHRLNPDRFARRDAMMRERGWRILRIVASTVDKDKGATIAQIERWISAQSLDD